MNVALEVNLLIERCPPEQFGELMNELCRALLKTVECLNYANPKLARRMVHETCEALYKAARVQ